MNLVYYGITVVGLTSAVLNAENRMGFSRHGVGSLRVLAVALSLAGVTLQLWCITLFQRKGGGTPSPLWPPRQFVIAGPYRWLRNPMNVGELVVFVALAAWFNSRALAIYAFLAWLAFHLFVVSYEEPGLAQRFGGRYDTYRREVRRWVPKILAG